MTSTAPRPMDDAFPRWSETLRDRRHVVIRPITAQDRDEERRFIEALSPETRRFRFLGQVARPSDDTLRHLTEIDRAHDAAFVAVTREGSQDPIVGVSRYAADAEGLRCECAVTVDDAWQGKGLGTLLMRHLIEVARARGMRSMYSIDDPDNLEMTDLAHFLGFRTTVDPDDPTLVVHELAL